MWNLSENEKFKYDEKNDYVQLLKNIMTAKFNFFSQSKVCYGS